MLCDFPRRNHCVCSVSYTFPPPTQQLRTFQLLFLDNHQNERQADPPHEVEGTKKRVKRRVDYPSFAYDARGQYEAMRRSRSNQNKEDDSELIATYKQPCQDPRKVSIPE
mmetsp:Transcript_6037/g.11004  ORF Transcript_6037/g.11004 Transcript_6037/m.11004 type:complete len:110 (-) Transcript_6037:738-1067(-)